jgi:steroid-24-oyl-CoA synthetase
MGMSFEQAVEAVTAPGQPFHMSEAEVNGQMQRVFTQIPPTMRFLFDMTRAHGDKIYVVYEDEQWSYNRLFALADATADALVNRYGIEPGDRVAIAMRNYPEWITSYIAITSIGAVVVALNAWWTKDEMHYGLEDSGSKAVFADVQRAKVIAPLQDDLDFHLITVRADEQAPGERLEDVMVEGAACPPVEIGPDDPLSILYTSGTTGFPKGAVSTHRAVLNALLGFASRAAVQSLVEPDTEEVKKADYPTSFILCIPLFHVTGLVPVMLGSFVAGAKLVIMYRWDPARALELIERERVTNFVAVPTMSWDLLESDDFAKTDTSSLKSVGGGGAPAPPELVRRVDDGFARARPGIGYGMTETNALGPQNSGDDYMRKPTSSGRAAPNMDVQVMDENGNELPRGEVGEICFRGANLITGYWGKPEATAETIRDGWLYSGDIGRMDEEGFIYVEDRAKDMVLRAGENIYCAEVEAAIYEHESVHEAAVFGLPHERLGEEVAVAVMARSGHSIDPDGLQSHVAQHLAKFKVPAYVFVYDEPLPRNASGKILKRDIRDQVLARREA